MKKQQTLDTRLIESDAFPFEFLSRVAVRVALGPMERRAIADAYNSLSEGIGAKMLALYRSKDSGGQPCDVLYYFWVMQAPCTECTRPVDLFSSYVIAQNAYPKRKPE